MDNFENSNLHKDIKKAILLCGYKKPTPVQAQSIPPVMAGRDVVVSAQTGTGKTASFVLPALQLLHQLNTQPSKCKKTRILILTPTRELANQITKASNLYGKFMRFTIISLVGGTSYGPQIKNLIKGADIIVATPGRLMDHIEQKRLDLSTVTMLILDEADRMLDMGFIDDVKYIAKLTPTKRQTLLYSATLTNNLIKTVKHLLTNPVRIDLSNEAISPPQIKQEMYKVNHIHDKYALLKYFLSNKNIYKAIIFSATKINANKLANQLNHDGFVAAALHGDLRQNVRNRTLEQLRKGKIQCLVATDVAARGIDVTDITHVINYDLPKFCEDYVHRIGRTGRAGKSGIAISFVLPTDHKHLRAIERLTNQRIKLIDCNHLITPSQKVQMHEKQKPQQQPYAGKDKFPRKEKRSDHPFNEFKKKKNKKHFSNASESRIPDFKIHKKKKKPSNNKYNTFKNNDLKNPDKQFENKKKKIHTRKFKKNKQYN